jgi:hypothetical protein
VSAPPLSAGGEGGAEGEEEEERGLNLERTRAWACVTVSRLRLEAASWFVGRARLVATP